MSQNPENLKELRSNISLTGDASKLLRKLHTILQDRNRPVNVSLTDVVGLALAKLEAELIIKE